MFTPASRPQAAKLPPPTETRRGHGLDRQPPAGAAARGPGKPPIAPRLPMGFERWTEMGSEKLTLWISAHTPRAGSRAGLGTPASSPGGGLQTGTARRRRADDTTPNTLTARDSGNADQFLSMGFENVPLGVIGCRRRGRLTGSGGLSVGSAAGDEFRDGRVGRGRRERSDRRSAPDARAASPGRLRWGSRPLFGVLPRRNLPERLCQVAALPHPVTVPPDVHDVAVVEQPMQQRRRHHLVPEDRPPLLGLPARGQYRRGSPVGLADLLEDEGRPVPVQRPVADLVHHQQGVMGEDPQPPHPRRVQQHHDLFPLAEVRLVELARRPEEGRTASNPGARARPRYPVADFCRRRTPPLAIRIKQEGRNSYLETDTIADWVKAISMGLAVKGPPALREIFALPDNLDDFETTEHVLAAADRLRADLRRKRRRSRPASSRRGVVRRADTRLGRARGKPGPSPSPRRRSARD